MDGFSMKSELGAEVKPKEITDSEYKTYENIDYQNNEKGFLGELAVDKALESLGLAYSSNPKDDAVAYRRTQAKGADHKLTEIDTEIEVKNVGTYPFTFSMLRKTVLPRYSPRPDDCWRGREALEEIPRIEPGFHKLLIATNLNATDSNIRYVGESGIFIIVLGFQVGLGNFDGAVRVLRGKILRFLRRCHENLYNEIIYSSCNRLNDSKEGSDGKSNEEDYTSTLFTDSKKILQTGLYDYSIDGKSGSDSATTSKYTGYGPDPPPYIDGNRRTETDLSEETIDLSEEATNLQKQRTSWIEDVRKRISTLKERLFSVEDRIFGMIIPNEKMENLDFWMEAEEKGKTWMILKHLWSSLIERVRGWRSDDEKEMYREFWDPSLNRYVREYLYCTECGARLTEAEIEEGKSMCYDCEMEAHTNLDYEEDEIVL